MTVKTILDEKGRDVLKVRPDNTGHEAVRIMADNRVGALVVTDSEDAVLGIVSERDIVRHLAEDGASSLDKPLRNIMTSDVETCRESNTITEVMEVMTAGRFRHLPVEIDGRLAGIVSIGDVVKRRIAEAEREAEDIKSYIAS